MESIINFFNEHKLFFIISGSSLIVYYTILFLSSDYFNSFIKNLYKTKSNSENLYKFESEKEEIPKISSDDSSESIFDSDLELNDEVVKALDKLTKQNNKLSNSYNLDDILEESGIKFKNESEEDTL